MKPSDQFGPMLRAEARRRNIGGAEEMIFISDAAHYFKEIARTCFPQATWVLDFYHASEHLHDLIHYADSRIMPTLHASPCRWHASRV